MGAAGGWEQYQADGQQADGRSQLLRGDYNSSSSIPAAGGWEQQDLAVLPWLENAAQGGQRRRVLAPNSSAAASSNPFLDVCSVKMDSGRPLTDMIMEGFTPDGVSTNIPPHMKYKHAMTSLLRSKPCHSVAETQTTITTVERPTGAKKEKHKLKQHSSIEDLDYLLAKKKEVDVEKELKKEERELKKQEMCQKALALQEERIKLDKEKFDFEQDREEERIMNVDMSTMSTRE
ncbi:unnamed protein product [Miscanthus lutarioriparius]|uniref:No apical meristem-associated C-terminal domain-containing protein n=1 Tax=Miscanthus lutarioriparius TaxID=422564 RepID=A0A811RGA4_9POAL|nr:unnamed protein product [Miscanthus lutarioriparius]